MGKRETTASEQIRMAAALLNEAADALRADQGERAVWRLVDAAGLLGRLYGGEGFATPTGRGFQIQEM